MVSRRVFERLVAEAVETLPEYFLEKMDNVEVVVEEWPDRETLQQAGVAHPAELLGFYRGVPLTRRTSSYGMVLPDKITIYRRPILMRCRSHEEVRETVQRVIRHELAHHFGLDDERLRELGV